MRTLKCHLIDSTICNLDELLRNILMNLLLLRFSILFPTKLCHWQFQHLEFSGFWGGFLCYRKTWQLLFFISILVNILQLRSLFLMDSTLLCWEALMYRQLLGLRLCHFSSRWVYLADKLYKDQLELNQSTFELHRTIRQKQGECWESWSFKVLQFFVGLEAWVGGEYLHFRRTWILIQHYYQWGVLCLMETN